MINVIICSELIINSPQNQFVLQKQEHRKSPSFRLFCEFNKRRVQKAFVMIFQTAKTCERVHNLHFVFGRIERTTSQIRHTVTFACRIILSLILSAFEVACHSKCCDNSRGIREMFCSQCSVCVS